MPRNSVYAPYQPIARPARAQSRDVPRESLEIAHPSGPAAAVVVAAGLASFVLGLFSVLTAASGSVSSALTLSERVGDISGVTTAAAVTFAATWAVLGIAWRHADPPLARVATTAAVLIALGLLGTFPPFFNAIGG
jgi:hypothetical protein